MANTSATHMNCTEAVNESSDCRAVTNKVATYDFLGSEVPAGTPLGVTSNVYGGATFTRTLTRDPGRRDLVLNVANSTGGDYAYTYDALSRPVTRNGNAFVYNSRSEVVSSRRGAESAEAYAYDELKDDPRIKCKCRRRE